MKAKINKFQIAKILWNHLPTNPSFSHFIKKADIYYSFDGIVPKKPKHIARIRGETVCLLEEAVGKDNFVNIFPYSEADPEGLDKITEKIVNLLQNKEEPPVEGEKKFVLTVKEKNTFEGGEINEETEGDMTPEAYQAFEKVMKMANFKPYFRKSKNSVSFYTEFQDKLLHCEIVSVSGSDIYLEVEYCSDEPEIVSPLKTIKDFYENYGITEFDTRSWVDIAEESLQKNK